MDFKVEFNLFKKNLPYKRLVDLCLGGQDGSFGTISEGSHKNKFSDLLLGKLGFRLIYRLGLPGLLILATNFNFNQKANYYNNLIVKNFWSAESQ